MKDTKVAMLGLGEMNGAILAGVLEVGVAPGNIVATTRSGASASTARERFGIRVLAVDEEPDANREAVAEADIVFLGVLPSAIAGIAESVKDAVRRDAVLVSVAAGVTTAMIEAVLNSGQAVIRSMPNTPLAVGLGVVGLTPGASTDEVQLRRVVELFARNGSVHVIDENLMDQLNAMTGSGPGYLYYLAEHLTAAGVELGFDQEVAAALAAQTMLGASTLLVRETATDPAAATTLRAGMWLPGGTTAAAYDVFDQHGMALAIRAGVKASSARSTEIARELAGSDV